MENNEARQRILDEEHLRLLCIGYWISAAATAFLSLIGLLYLGMGLFFEQMIKMNPSGSQPPPRGFGLIFSVIGLGIFGVMASLAAIKAYTAHCLKNRRARVFCMVVAAITCLGIPYGTALGVLSFLVLSRPSVVHLFDYAGTTTLATGSQGGT